jgi:hypothetical protein
MPYRLLDADADPDPAAVRRVTFVPFLPSGECAAVPGDADGSGAAVPSLPSDLVAPGEHYLLDTALRVPLATIGFRMQRVRPFAFDDADGHLYAWLDGDRYTGRRPHADRAPLLADADRLADLLAAAGRADQARAVRDASASYRAQTDAQYYADNVRLLEPAYLRGSTPQQGSGFSGDAEQWREHRAVIADCVHKDGTFLDLGCANGLLMESVRAWAAERGHAVEPYGVDLAPRLVALARRRLPAWADRIEVGNAIDYLPADGRRFTFVHALTDTVPAARIGDLVAHARAALVEPGGRLLVSVYLSRGASHDDAATLLTRIGHAPDGQLRHASPDGHVTTTAWFDVGD